MPDQMISLATRMSSRPADRDMAGRLNIFQRSMLLWNQLHPYNAVHVLKLGGRLDAAWLESTINELLERYGLTDLVVDRRRKRFRYCGGAAGIRVRIVSAGPETQETIREQIQVELNTPFPVGQVFTPFRFFAVEAREGFHLGAAYCHFVSDADSMLGLLGRIVSAYGGGQEGRDAPAPELCLNRRRDLLPLILRHGPRWAAGFPRFVGRLVQSTKPRYASRTDHANGFRSFALAPEQFHALADTARSWQVTLNDVFLAAMIKSVAPLAAERARTARRKKIAVSCVASARPDLPERLSHAFGLALGSFVVCQPVPEAVSLRHLARSIRRRTAVVKREKLYLRTLTELRVALSVMPPCSKDRQQKLYRQHYPLWGAVSNVNFNRPAGRLGETAVLEYHRAVSTGPVCPLVLAVTSFHDVLSIGASFRNAVFSAQTITDVLSAFTRCLSHPADM